MTQSTPPEGTFRAIARQSEAESITRARAAFIYALRDVDLPLFVQGGPERIPLQGYVLGLQNNDQPTLYALAALLEAVRDQAIRDHVSGIKPVTS